MAEAVYLIALPLLSFVILLLFGSKFSRLWVSLIGIGGIAMSAAHALNLFSQSLGQASVKQVLWTFLPADLFGYRSIDLALRLDSLSLTMCLVVTFVSTLIALYSSEFMESEEGLCRFFSVVNLFVAFMLILVLADNLLFLFMGWEGVGLCSYLLIGFYYREQKAENAAMKAFITTRVGDVFLLFGMLICLLVFNTLDIQEILEQAQAVYPNGSTLITIAAFCLLGGAAGKSAQLPLQTWLADAMWGPTPVSALIHAATMVTAGVYLVARMSGLILLSSEAQVAVLIVGGATMLLAGIAALVQTDMKRVLAYSTMSQIGYMFLALGAGAYEAAIFHLATHAFFKALLFLSAGVIGHALHTYDLRHMGGLFRQMPGLFSLFLIGCLSLVGLPLVSAGFFSKEWIMTQVFVAPVVGPWAFGIGVIGAFLTGLYTFRMLIIAFFGEAKSIADAHGGWRLLLPLYVLALFSVGLGWLETPDFLGHIHLMSSFLSKSLPEIWSSSPEGDALVILLPSITALLGIMLAIWLYGILRLHHLKRHLLPVGLIELLKGGGGFDWLYQRVFIKPYVALSYRIKTDVVESWSRALVDLVNGAFGLLDRLHTGRMTHYVSFLIMAALALASVMVFG